MFCILVTTQKSYYNIDWGGGVKEGQAGMYLVALSSECMIKTRGLFLEL